MDVASTLVAAGVDLSWLERFAEVMPPPYLAVGLSYPVRALESDSLIDEITDAVERISGLLTSAKQYTQMDRAPLQTFDVHEGIDATMTMLAHKLDGIEVVRDYDRGLPKITAFPGELNQVWTNLIDNAVDAMDGDGKLTIRTRPDGDDRLVVEIGDTGPGVPDDVRGRVFEPFFTTKEVGKGTGLGLDIAWRIIVGRHGGELRLESTPGDTRFQVVLPRTQVDPRTAHVDDRGGRPVASARDRRRTRAPVDVDCFRRHNVRRAQVSAPDPEREKSGVPAMTILISTVEGGETKVGDDELEQLRASLRGDVLTPADDGYDANPIYNAMHNRRPALKVRPTGTADVVDTVNFARERNLVVTVRGGGHSVAGLSSCDGGIVIDLAPHARRERRPDLPTRVRAGRRGLG